MHQQVELSMQRYIDTFPLLENHHPCPTLETQEIQCNLTFLIVPVALNTAQKPIQFFLVCARKIRVQADLLYLPNC